MIFPCRTQCSLHKESFEEVDILGDSPLLNSHPVNWSVDFRRFCEIALVGLKTHEIDVAATALPQWCTSWSPELMSLVRTPGVQPRGITYLLADGLLGVRTLRRGLVEAAAARAFFGGFCP